ncbi:MAG TPA: peptidase M28 family protein [Bacteroidales bacterium]|nr:peptidase M28 family protein [Bacteroidales bacterium]
MRYIITLLFSLSLFLTTHSQAPEEVIKSIFNDALTDNTAEEHLLYLCKNTKGRIPGSQEALHAVRYTMGALKEAGADTVWLQEVPVPHWKRGNELAILKSELGSIELTISALGLSVGTGPDGLEGNLMEVHRFEELKEMGEGEIEGKIIFFNRPVDNTMLNTFSGYGGAVNQRISGASEAAKYGAKAVIVRSPTQAMHDFVHTGVVRYQENIPEIPAVCVSPHDAEIMSRWLKKDKKSVLYLLSDCMNYPDTISYNVIGEIRGNEMPGEYITVGGHLDAWDISEGAHDDGGGCVQSIETIRLFTELGIKPRRSIRAVMFMNEEMTSTGGAVYADEAEKNGEIHYAALESDRGVLSPLGFGFGNADNERLEQLFSLEKYFRPYGIRYFARGGGGSDISPLGRFGALQIGYIPDTQRYFWFHHSANDTFEQVNIREMQLGSAAIASLIYLIDMYDL